MNGGGGGGWLGKCTREVHVLITHKDSSVCGRNTKGKNYLTIFTYLCVCGSFLGGREFAACLFV